MVTKLYTPNIHGSTCIVETDRNVRTIVYESEATGHQPHSNNQDKPKKRKEILKLSKF